jgi:hypothetical protein
MSTPSLRKFQPLVLQISHRIFGNGGDIIHGKRSLVFMRDYAVANLSHRQRIL